MLKHIFVGLTWGLITAFAFERLSWPINIYTTNAKFLQSIICLSIYTICTLVWLIFLRKKFKTEQQKFFYEFEKCLEPEELIDCDIDAKAKNVGGRVGMLKKIIFKK